MLVYRHLLTIPLTWQSSLTWPDPLLCRAFIAYTASDIWPAQKRVWPHETNGKAAVLL